MTSPLEPRRRALLASLAALGAWSAGCSGTPRPKPTPLEPLTPRIAGRVVWTRRVDGLAPASVLATAGGAYTVASRDGQVLALEADSGRELWRATAGGPLSAGPGTDGRFTAVVTAGGELVVLEQARVRWRQRIGTTVVTPPLVAGERVFVLATNRSVQAFDALDGSRLWGLQRPGDPLTLTQVGVLAPFKDTLLVGQGSRLVGVDPTRGIVRWEVALATPRGTNEVERLADLVGPIARQGDQVCARAFQAAVACANADRAALVWSRVAGGTQSVAADAGIVVGADATDRITAWRAPSGEVAWTQEKLLYRGLSGAAIADRTVIFGDSEGQVHFLDRDTGELQLRLATDGSAVVAPPAVIGQTVLAGTRDGGLFAMRPL